MSNDELILISIVGFALLGIIFILNRIILRTSPSYSFVMKKKTIKWRIVLKYWVICQAVSLFLNSSHISIGTFLFPLFLISFLIVYAASSFSISSNDEVKNVLKDNQVEYEEYEKSFKRDRKLKKLLK